MADWPGQGVVNQAGQIPRGFAEIWGYNRGPWPDRVNRDAGVALGSPYCGSTIVWLAHQAGKFSAYDGTASPATGTTYLVAKAHGWLWNGGRIPPGAIWVNPWKHSALVKYQLNADTVATFEGNHSNGFYDDTRSVHGYYVVIPPWTAVAPPPPIDWDYAFDDLKAHPFMFGGVANSGGILKPGMKGYKVAKWRTKAARDRELQVLLRVARYRPYHPRPHYIKTWRRYVILMGPLVHYGPFATKAMRDAALKHVMVTLGRVTGFRTYRFLDKTPDE